MWLHAGLRCRSLREHVGSGSNDWCCVKLLFPLKNLLWEKVSNIQSEVNWCLCSFVKWYVRFRAWCQVAKTTRFIANYSDHYLNISVFLKSPWNLGQTSASLCVNSGWYGSKKLQPACAVIGNKSTRFLKSDFKDLFQLPLFCAITWLSNTLGCSHWHELVNLSWMEIDVLIPATLKKNTLYLPGVLSALNCRLNATDCICAFFACVLVHQVNVDFHDGVLIYLLFVFEWCTLSVFFM